MIQWCVVKVVEVVYNVPKYCCSGIDNLIDVDNRYRHCVHVQYFIQYVSEGLRYRPICYILI